MVFNWLTKMILLHVKNIVFLYVCLNTIFSQWPKALYNTDVYEIKLVSKYNGGQTSIFPLSFQVVREPLPFAKYFLPQAWSRSFERFLAKIRDFLKKSS